MASKPGIIFYPEHIELIQELLTTEEAGELLFAASNYVENGVVPDGKSKAFMAIFKLIRGKLDENTERMKKRSLTNAQNARARNRGETAASDHIDEERPQAIANDCKQSKAIASENERPQAIATTNPNVSNRIQAEGSNMRAPAAFLDDEDLSASIADHNRAAELICRFGLPDCDTSREAVLEDAERLGWEAVENALKTAAASNSRPMLSVNFYRAVLNGRSGDTADPYAGIASL